MSSLHIIKRSLVAEMGDIDVRCREIESVTRRDVVVAKLAIGFDLAVLFFKGIGLQIDRRVQKMTWFQIEVIFTVVMAIGIAVLTGLMVAGSL